VKATTNFFITTGFKAGKLIPSGTIVKQVAGRADVGQGKLKDKIFKIRVNFYHV
jgi:hypothetical protein